MLKYLVPKKNLHSQILDLTKSPSKSNELSNNNHNDIDNSLNNNIYKNKNIDWFGSCSSDFGAISQTSSRLFQLEKQTYLKKLLVAAYGKFY